MTTPESAATADSPRATVRRAVVLTARIAIVLVAIGVLVLMTGCDSGGEAAKTADEARGEAVTALQDAGTTLSGATLRRLPDQDVPCTGLAADVDDPVTVGVVFEVDGVMDDAAAIDALRTHWESRGYRVEGDPSATALRVGKDNLRLTYSAAAGGTRLTAAVSCVER